jgi:Ca2+-binding RTX toxin-like protein
MGTKLGDTLTGNALANTLISRKGKDLLVGDLGNDILKAGHGKDRIHGGEGADLITGGRGRDRFLYYAISDSTTVLRDTVKFGKNDRFVFQSFDGNSIIEGQQDLVFIGQQAFSGIAGELRANRSTLQIDTNGDAIADVAINLSSNNPISANNLVL